MTTPVYEIDTTCVEGINQNPSTVQKEQCSDALNVWAPNGVVEERPGTSAVWNASNPSTSAFADLIYEDVSAGTFTTVLSMAGDLDLSNAVARTVVGGVVTVQPDRWYLGSAALFNGSNLILLTANANAVQAEVEYWNGGAWVPLHGFSNWTRVLPTQYQILGTHLACTTVVSGSLQMAYRFVPPVDWVASSIATVTNFWIRFVLVNNGDAALDATTVISNNGIPVTVVSATTTRFSQGVLRARFQTAQRYVVVGSPGAESETGRLYIADSVPPTDKISFTANIARERTWAPTIATIPEVGEFYVAHNAQTFRFSSSPTTADDILAHAEDRDFAIGPGAPWDQRTVALLGAFPAAKFIMYFQNRLWIVTNDDLLYWSASVPYHRVWPALAFARLAEDDNSPVTGMAALQEFAVVTKTDSIWIAAFEGLNAFDVPSYMPRKVVAGTGCVSNGSIQKIRGELVFLAEEDIVAFNGVGARSVTEDSRTGTNRLKELMARITPGARQWASSAHWKAKRSYLLSVPLDGASSNTHTIVWDYAHDTFWLWDIAADFWMIEEGPNDEEVPYFATTGGYVYRLGGSDDDGIAINSYVTTRRLGWQDGVRKAVTSVEVATSNSSDGLRLDVYRNGSAVSKRTITLRTNDNSQAEWGTAKWDTAKWGETYELTRPTRALRTGNMDHVQVRVSRNGGPLKVSKVTAGFTLFPGRQ